jgi:hypothetical protein
MFLTVKECNIFSEKIKKVIFYFSQVVQRASQKKIPEKKTF